MSNPNPCPHRSSADAFAWCNLVGDFVGERNISGVHESLCRACQSKGAPDLTAPNPYLASVAYKAANAKAKQAKAAGDKPGWFHWAGLGHFFRAHLQRINRTPAKTEATAAERATPCEHLGRVVERRSCNCPRKHRYECGRFRDSVGDLPLLVSPAAECEGCKGYEPDVDAAGAGD
jgi:hypothetical protein